MSYSDILENRQAPAHYEVTDMPAIALTATYEDLMTQAQTLIARAEQIRQQERAGVIANIAAQLAEHGLTVDDLRTAAPRKPKPARPAHSAKYRGPNGELWAGGRGRKPGWVVAALARGESLDAYLV
jgi:DNA-binding protein H-NS